MTVISLDLYLRIGNFRTLSLSVSAYSFCLLWELACCLNRGASSHRLVPGDIVVLLAGKSTCDVVLLQGNCLVEESVLSGEV